MEMLTFSEIKMITAHIVTNGEINYEKLVKYVDLKRSIDDIHKYMSRLEMPDYGKKPLTNAEKLVIWTLENKKLTPEQRRRMGKELINVRNPAAFETECYEIFRRWFT